MEQPEAPPTYALVAGKYELIKMIGRGGMGSVWEGKHHQLGTRVAIKFIESEYAKSDEALKRFKNEALAAAKIESKHAIKIHDYGVQDGKPFIVMELLNGEPLDKRLERVGRLSPQDTARIVQQVCRALQRAHEHGIVHRDLKPENVFLVHEDDDEIAKVLDFGIAKMKDPAQDQISSTTKTGAVLGTPYYMSPEQARGLRTIDHRTDLWSMGVIAFKCVTGKLPFEGESLGDLLVKICTAPAPVPSHTLPGLPASFDAWFARALDRDPNQRYGTAAELAEALAYACGVSVKRGPMSAIPSGNSGSYGQPTPTGPMSHVPSSALQQQPMRTPQPSYPTAQSPQSPYNATSAPFTSSVPARSGSKGLVVAAIGAAMVGIALGVFGVVKLAGGSHQDADKPAPLVETAKVAAQPPPSATVAADPPPLPPLTTTGGKPPVSFTPAQLPHSNTGTKPTATATVPTATASTAPTVPAPPTATVPPHPTATTKPTGDLGPGF